MEGRGVLAGDLDGLAPLRVGQQTAMIRRLLFVVFFAFGGFLFYVPKWILFGAKASRDRKKLIRLAKKQNRLLERQTRS
jgi:hypothetical protein